MQTLSELVGTPGGDHISGSDHSPSWAENQLLSQPSGGGVGVGVGVGVAVGVAVAVGVGVGVKVAVGVGVKVAVGVGVNVAVGVGVNVAVGVGVGVKVAVGVGVGVVFGLTTSTYLASLGMPLVKTVTKAGPGGKLLTGVEVKAVSDQPAVGSTGRKATWLLPMSRSCTTG
jgi:hypothetical protein